NTARGQGRVTTSSAGGWNGRTGSGVAVATAMALTLAGDCSVAMELEIDRDPARVGRGVRRDAIGRGTSATATVEVESGDAATTGAGISASTARSTGAWPAGATTPAATWPAGAGDEGWENGLTTSTAAMATDAASAAPPIQRR